MDVFLLTLSQMGLLFTFIIIGYILAKFKIVPDNAGTVLSKMENNVFTPASILATFLANFTIAKLSSAWQLALSGVVVVLAGIPIAILIARLCTKDSYVRKIYTYGLAFSNFGFMGNAVVLNVYGDAVYMDYLIFVIPFWVAIYGWGVPALLMPESNGQSIGARLKNLANPMLIATLLGIVFGLLSVPVPSFVSNAISMLVACMSPIAMLLTGMAIAKINLKEGFTNITVYIISVVRLAGLPLWCIAIMYFIPLSYEIKLCSVCACAMPLGLSTIVIPSAYGLDTKVASGMALVSHLLSCISIPLVFMLFDMLFK